MEIKWSDLSKKDLEEFLHYAREGTKRTVKNYIHSLIDCVGNLKLTPYIGKVIFKHNELEYRILIYRKYKILYTITDTINIVSIIHSSRDIHKIIEELKMIEKYF